MSNNRQLLVLFLGSFTIVFAGMGLFPVLPLYATQFGATRTQVGLYLTIIYVAITVGSFVPGWLAEKVSRRALFIAAGVVGIPGLALMGQVTALWQLELLTAVVWFCGGVGLALVSVFTGMIADSRQRGKSFSLMSLASPLGALLGGAMVSWLLAWQNYGVLFWVYGASWLALPLIGLFGLPAETKAPKGRTTVVSRSARPSLGFAFVGLAFISLLAAVAVNVGRFGASVSMQALNFSASAVASTATISGLATIPLAFSLGTLSDRLGRKQFLALSYVMSAAGVLLLITAVHLWHFWLAATLVLVSRSVSDAVSAALATDVLDPAALARGLPLLNGLTRAAGIVSFVGAGAAMDHLGMTALYVITAVLALLATLQLAVLGNGRRAAETADCLASA